MTLEERLNNSETRSMRLVFPNLLNHVETLYGGWALQWMDEVAFITATRFSRQTYVTVSLERIDFKKPISSGTLVELVGRVLRVGRTSVQVQVEIFIEQMYAESRESAIHGEFTMVALDDNRRPTPIRHS
jgi:acyl-CoA hydrolase